MDNIGDRVSLMNWHEVEEMPEEMSSEESRRAYDNSRRQARAQQTRERIIEGVVDACLDQDLDDLSVAAVSERTGVSPATIYRYFPNREVLLEAVDRRLGEKLGRPRLPESIDGLVEYMPELFVFFEENIELMKLARSTADKLERETSLLRDRYLMALLEEEIAHLPAEEARSVQAVFRSLFSLDLYLMQRDRFDSTPEAAGRATQWAMRTLLQELRSDRLRGNDLQTPENQDGESS